MPADTSNLDQITAFLAAKGLTPAQVAGVAGNLQIESGLNPRAYNAREGAIGIAQWEGARDDRLRAFAAARGLDPNGLAAQLLFLWDELTGTESRALAALRKTTTPAEAAAVFDQTFERSAGTSRGARIAAAEAIYNNTGGQGFRAQGGAFTTDGSIPQPGLWPALENAGQHMDDSSSPSTIVDTVIDAVAQPILAFAMKALFIAAGIGIVIVGMAKTVEPGVKKAANVVAEVKPI